MSDRDPIVTVTPNPVIDQTLMINGFSAGQVNRVESSRLDAGGKGVNVGTVLADLGTEVILTGLLGSDNASLFEQHFRARPRMLDRFVRIPGATRTGIKIVDDRNRSTTDINFPGLTPPADAVEALKARVDDLARPGRWFVLSGSVPPGLGTEVYARLIRLVRAKGAFVALDTSGAALRAGVDARPDIIKPNTAELEELVGRKLQSVREVREAAGALVRDGGLKLVAVSMGAEGAVFVDHHAGALLTRPPRVEVKSTVGAGDAMLAGIVLAMRDGQLLDQCARLATSLGAYAVTRIGAGLARPGDYERYQDQVVLETI